MNRLINETARLMELRASNPQKWINKTKGKNRSTAVISMSVLPSRFEGLKPTLNSLTDQSVLPEKIIINLPRFFKRDQSNYEIPDFVRHHPLVQINWIDEDLGPATKLLPALNMYEAEPDKLIIVVDDDQIYSRQMIENYIHHAEQLPDAALTLSGWTVPESFNHANKVQIYGAIVRVYRKDTSIKQPMRVDCLQGAASFAVRPKLFDDRVFNFENAPKEAFFVDDIWISGNLSRTGSAVYVIPAPFRFGRFVSLRQSTKFGLSTTVNATHDNNNGLYRFFENDWWSIRTGNYPKTRP